MTLQALVDLVAAGPGRKVLVIAETEWMDVAPLIHPSQFVQATVERPAYFWFLDRKIVTPATIDAHPAIRREIIDHLGIAPGSSAP